MTEQNNDINILSKWRGVLMGFSALWILFYHEYIPLVTTPVFLYKIEKFVKRIGFCGVDIFFLLSGMGLTYAIQKTNLPRFY